MTLEHQVLIHRFGLEGEKPKTLGEVGEIVGLTPQKVRQVELRAMHAIKALIEA